ncbi:putative erythromycin esterase [Botryosphaeria dothidea]|uniref:Erythromycin esterase n=1 Tax=Botryosphaeria dothidea TaxID=55169 RepID=A0A8H4IKH2_9PEZI|nr:putative erythromycin esterase [Botryosphaeria dothidea]
MVRPCVPSLIKEAAERLPSLDDNAFGAMFDSFGQSRVVLIGDGSHGTSEFYRARAAITKHLIQHHGFNIVAIEADWPDAKAVDRYVQHTPSKSTDTSLKDLGAFNHFPRWMWRNTEVQSFVHWLRRHNVSLAPEKRTSFAGLDLYSLGTSMRQVQDYLSRHDPDAAALAKKRYSCLERWTDDPALYGRHAFIKSAAPCEQGVVAMLRDLLQKRLALMAQDDGEDFFDAEMNARLVRDAEEYYRAMYYGSDASWNLRDSHFFSTLLRLLQNREGARAVVWAHNSHVGDARFTGMGESRNELNLGQLCKEQFGASCSIIGCGSHAGTVAAAHGWDDPMEVMDVNPSRPDSYEWLMHETGLPSFMLDLREGKLNEDLRAELLKKRLQRFIGVMYRPDTERWSHYSQAILPRQFDCYVWFDETEAVHAFERAQPDEPPSAGETYPFGY